MADLNENLVTYIDTLTTFHVGEVVPQDVSTGYVFLQQSGETERDCLEEVATIETVFFNIEIAATDIDSVRTEAATIKSAFRELGKFPSGFESLVELFIITDHDDEYLYQSIDADTRLEVAALSLSVHQT